MNAPTSAPMNGPLSLPRWLSLCLGLLLVLCLAGPRAAQAKPVPVPPMSSRVVDLAQALPPGEAEALRAQIADIQSRTQAQLAVLIVPTTGEDTIEGYATRVFAKWRLGRSDADDGILLLVAQKDRRMRIEVGTGLEGTVTDIQAARIIDREMAPRFREGDFAGGVQAAVGALARLLDGEVGVVAPESQQIVVDHAAAPVPTPDDEKVTSLTRGGHVTPEGWGLLGVVLWGLGLGIYHGRGIERDPPRGTSASRRAEEKKRKGRRNAGAGPEPWADALAAMKPEPARARPAPRDLRLVLGLLGAGPLAAGAALLNPAIALVLAMPAIFGYGLGFLCGMSRTAAIFMGGFVLVIASLVAIAFTVGADRFWWGFLWALCIGGVTLFAVIIVRCMVNTFQRSVISFVVRLAIVAGICGYVFHITSPGPVPDTSWIPIGLAAFFSMLIGFLPPGVWESGSSDDDGDSGWSSSSSSSSSSSDSGGSSSGGGASGSW